MVTVEHTQFTIDENSNDPQVELVEVLASHPYERLRPVPPERSVRFHEWVIGDAVDVNYEGMY